MEKGENRPIPVLVDAIRTPLGKYGGNLSGVRSDDLLAILLQAMKERHPNLDIGIIDDIIIGCANQAGEDARNVARMAAIAAGYPFEVPAQTLNRLCGSSMQAVISAATLIQSGWGKIFLAGGVESMSRAPLVMAKSEKAFPFGSLTLYDTSLGWRFPNPKIEERIRPLTMGETAEELFTKFQISRKDQDRYAFQSHQRAIRARKDERFSHEVIPVHVQTKRETRIVTEDEGPREDTTLEQLAQLPSAFKKDGTVTAGNSCPMSDGAAVTLMMPEELARSVKFHSWFRLKSAAVTALHPDVMGLGPIESTRLALKRANLSLDEIGLIEINEAFAVQVLACVRELGMDENKVNVNGGAIALGHPLGCSGARIIGTLIHEMRRRNLKYGLASMCIGLGQGIATVWEKIDS